MNVNEYEKMYKIETTHWWSAGRRRIVQDNMDALTPGTGKILDVGCGTGIILETFKNYGCVVGIDNSEHALKFCKLRGQLRLIQADIETQLPFKQDMFDTVFAFDVLEHLSDDAHVLNELYKVCKKGSHVIITVPAYQFMWSKHDESLHHKRRYSKKALRKAVQDAGFTLKKLSYFNTILFPLILAFRVSHIFRKEVKSDFYLPIPSFINWILLLIFSMEKYLLRKISLPFGLSLICIAKK
jgi:SAM-dependent methyltransferase